MIIRGCVGCMFMGYKHDKRNLLTSMLQVKYKARHKMLGICTDSKTWIAGKTKSQNNNMQDITMQQYKIQQKHTLQI